jgi:molybdopterin/thiamine biosynthesis adenylyltransferase
MTDDLQRYSKQVLFHGIGEAGQRELLRRRVLVCGCGALGTVLAEGMVRAGVGFVRIVDRDFVELSNLQRQVLFDEQDIADQLPKSVAAGRKLAKINSTIEIDPIVADVSYENVMGLAEGVDLILDGTDNFETRYLLNDVSLETGIPWIYGGCIGSHGQTMTILPGETACLRCLIDGVPEPGSVETCDTAGVLAAIINVIASLQVVDALKILSGQRNLIEPKLTVIDVWDGTFRRMNMEGLRDRSGCPACHAGERVWLRGTLGSQTTILCGRNAVQVSPSSKMRLSFDDLASRLAGIGTINYNKYLFRIALNAGDYELTAFQDGRVIIKGTEDIPTAKTLYAKYIGN